jgi:hypothetical protein
LLTFCQYLKQKNDDDEGKKGEEADIAEKVTECDGRGKKTGKGQYKMKKCGVAVIAEFGDEKRERRTCSICFIQIPISSSIFGSASLELAALI